ncbi:MAG: 7TM-DISM domain-containing protein [Thiolinea sp.]
MLWLLALSSWQPSYALEITDDMHQGKVVNLSDATLILQDPEHAFTPETAIRRMSAPNYVSESLTPSVTQYWFYTLLTNHSQHEQWIIRSASASLLYDRLDFYLYCQDQPLHYTPQPPIGLHSPTLANAYYIPVTLPNNTACVLLQQASGFALSNRIQLITPAVATQQSSQIAVLNLMGLGAIASLIIYNFLLFASIRNSTYFFYTIYGCFHLTLMILVNFKPPELTNLFATPHQALRVISASVMISAILFTLRFMRPSIKAARQNPAKPILSRILIALVTLCWVMISATLLSLLDGLIFPEHIKYAFRVNIQLYLFSSLLIPALSLVAALAGYKPAWVFLPAWTILLTGHIVGALNLLGMVDIPSIMPTILILAAALRWYCFPMRWG